MTTITATRAEVCVVACAEAFRGDGEILAAGIGGAITVLAARLARLTFEPDLITHDGTCLLTGDVPPLGGTPEVVEGWLPFRDHLWLVLNGRRHVMLGASQIDRYGNSNISCIGDWARPRSQLLGVRGAPGNTVCDPTSYWIPRHSPRVFVPRVDMVSGVGHDRAAEAGPSAYRHHDLRRVVTDLAVLDFDSPDHSMRLASVHPGVTVAEVVDRTGFPLAVPDTVPQTRMPTAEELRILREVLDPGSLREREVPDPGPSTPGAPGPDAGRRSGRETPA
ncbi:Acyl CoA:acetate/3-ketoacid CoA transferase, beta subunit [Streptosporangium canum]|uniref:Acyl CoA:acetate/3-ketoacid CoA transferase, beta subunit n=1 Tax=Streptosporangium canum TaxID=324952 RepID=A0A1I3U8Q5_9ACTN|nr:CoA-transferase [Streptosporangium canum]SFJ78131.1 Acyl CoA:acetate/3-ketoacid CoA transferase, beta subunit [Streptosporangium canum]